MRQRVVRVPLATQNPLFLILYPQKKAQKLNGHLRGFLALPCLLHAPGAHIFFFILFSFQLDEMNYPRHFGYCLSLFLFCIQKENRKIENLFFFSGDDDGQWKSKAAPTLENTFLRIHFACRMSFSIFTFEREFSKKSFFILSRRFD